MGFFDRLAGKRQAPSTPQPPSSAPAAPGPTETPAASATAGNIMPRLVAARDCLELKDLAGAMAIYEEVLATAGDRADALVTISGDLGATGHVREIVELVAPRYDAQRHGPATGLNILQAYLALRDPESAQHVLDILFALNRPELEDRLFGFSNAIAELLHAINTGQVEPAATAGANPGPERKQVSLVSISKPIWFYGLEPLADQVLPPKNGRQRRVAFAQLALLGRADTDEAMKRPEDELGRLTRALPLWFAESFYFSPHYAPIAAVGIFAQQHYALFGREWTTDNLRELLASNKEGLDYIFTGALREKDGECEVLLRVWEVKKLRERKQFTARWTAATADAELGKLHEQIRLFMEWSPEKAGLPYTPPASPRAWLETLGASLTLFVAEKNLLPREQLPPLEPALAAASAVASQGEAPSLAFVTLRNRAEKLEIAQRLEAALAASPLVAQATGLSL